MEEGRESECVGWGNGNTGRSKDGIRRRGRRRKREQEDVSHSFETAANAYLKSLHNEEKIQ